jgi:aldehyde:ferredoxin oxidoreductase
VFELDQMLDDYYETWGWDKKTGNPTQVKLGSLGLKSGAHELEKLNKLP